MNSRALGRSGIQVSEIGFGAWAIGGMMWGGARDADSRAALERAYEAGVNFVDTALVYGDGHSERLVGEFVRAHRRAGEREVVVATKVPPLDRRWPAAADARLRDVFPAEHIRRSCEASLANLGLDCIDLLQLHVFAEAWTDEDEWYAEMVSLRAGGRIRLIGVSVNDHQPETAVKLARSGRVDALQVIYNVFEQAPEDELLPACRDHGVGVLARVPFDEGSLTGKLRRDTVFPPGDFRSYYFGGGRLAETVDRVERLRATLRDSGVDDLARAALRYCLGDPAVSTVIPGMRDPAQASANTAASDDGPLAPSLRGKLRAHRWDRGGSYIA
jgi:aryl-alcohol dehydrogenase-like predicted oxidoreductase